MWETIFGSKVMFPITLAAVAIMFLGDPKWVFWCVYGVLALQFNGWFY
ncbi:hypothetical protein SAMN02799636_04317 [Methylobacterium sp. 275MFSha3.1]|nr:hypothetical protein SAMN02799636_04317 [Methylobacterium sp. 275MFSha3.1]